MPISLDEAKRNTLTPLDVTVIDEYRKYSTIADTLIFDDIVSATAGGGGVLSHGYRRLITQPTAATRALNTEYTDHNVETKLFYSNLAVMGGSFSIDRIIAKLGPAASGGIALNMEQKIKATSATFADMVINGDTATDANGFDGLDKALVGTSTEWNHPVDWTDFDTDNRAEHKALDAIDEFLSLLDGAPTIILGNKLALARVRAAARRAGMYTKNPVDGLLDANGRPVERELYGNILFGDPGEKAGSNNAVIPVAADGTTSLYAYRVGLDGFCGVSTAGGSIAQAWLPNFSDSGAVKRGEVELGPVGVELRATKAAAAWRGIKVRA